MMTIGITGGTGFVGKHITRLLVNKGYEVIVFTRNPSGKQAKGPISYAMLDAAHGKCDITALERVNAIIHLAGAGVADKRWSEARKKEIVDSRVHGTSFLVTQLAAHGTNCHSFIAASAIGYYGPDRAGQTPFTENAPDYPDFLSQTCVKWEAETQKAAGRLRTVIFRIGVVLGKESGAFPKFVKPVLFGIVPIIGGGKQVVSWISVDDLAAMFVFGLEQQQLSGIFNAVAPHPVSNRQLMKTITREKGGIKIFVPVPAFLLKVILGGMSEEVLKSCTVSADKIAQASFAFQYPVIDEAVRAILKSEKR
jgi:uncharacterized protein